MNFKERSKAALCLLLGLGLCLALSACAGKTATPRDDFEETAESEPPAQRTASGNFVEKDAKTLVASDGTEYLFLANAGILDADAEWEHLGYVEGEPKTGALVKKTGLFAAKGVREDTILLRVRPDSEWYAIYRKASLPPFDFTVDNCCRMELVLGRPLDFSVSEHRLCGEGITDPAEIAAFLADLRAQKTAREAGLFESITQAGGTLKNCYQAGMILCFFEEEPNLYLSLPVTSYDDQAYSVEVDRVDRVFPAEWLQRLRGYAS